jgi:hypothetical protein
VLNESRLIGATTSGAAIVNELIANAQPDVLIMEEAGEVSESHVISNLMPSLQHFIMIGDH